MSYSKGTVVNSHLSTPNGMNNMVGKIVSVFDLSALTRRRPNYPHQSIRASYSRQ